MNKSAKSILCVIIACVSIFVLFKYFAVSSIKYFDESATGAIKVAEYIAVYVPIFIIIVSIFAFCVKFVKEGKQ